MKKIRKYEKLINAMATLMWFIIGVFVFVAIITGNAENYITFLLAIIDLVLLLFLIKQDTLETDGLGAY